MKEILPKDLEIGKEYQDIEGSTFIMPTIFKVVAKLEDTNKLVMKYVSGDKSYFSCSEEEGEYVGCNIFSLCSSTI